MHPLGSIFWIAVREERLTFSPSLEEELWVSQSRLFPSRSPRCLREQHKVRVSLGLSITTTQSRLSLSPLKLILIVVSRNCSLMVHEIIKVATI